MLIEFDFESLEIRSSEDLAGHLINLAIEKFREKEKIITEKMMIFLCKIAILRTVDINWQEHLYEDDALRSGVGLMAHAQKDPLVEYKKRSAENFKDMIYKVNQEALEFIFRAQIKS